MQSVLIVSNSPDTKNKAGFLIFHPERNNLIPKFCPLRCYSWKCITHISDFGLIYVPPRTKQKFSVESGHIYVIGGYDNKKKKFLRTILRYDMLRGEWFHCRKMSTRRSCFTPFLYDGKIFCAGGCISKSVITDLVESYEPMMDITEVCERLPSPCSGYGCSYWGKKVFIIGGNIQLKNGVILPGSHFWSYENIGKSKDFSQMESLSKFINIENAKVPVENGISGHNVVICKKNNRIYIVGGTNKCEETETSTPGIYYANIDSIMRSKETGGENVIWNKRHIPEMQRSFNGTAIINNKIFVIGGLHNIFNSTVPIVEVDEDVYSDQNLRPSSMILGDPESNDQENGFPNNIGKQMSMVFVPVNEMIGYFDWRRKIYNHLFKLRNKEDINLESVRCIVVDMNDNYVEFNKGRYDWLLQWALW